MRLGAPWVAFGLLLGTGVGCLGLGTYACQGDDNCQRDGQAGSCLEGYCAYPDADCGSGLRYDDLAGGGLANACFGGGSTSDVTTTTDASTGPGSTSTTDPSTSTTDAETEGDTDPGIDCEDPACTDWDGDGHCVETDTAEPDCDDSNPTRWEGCKYLSPTGSDMADGSSPDNAWLTFAFAATQLQPSDSLVLVDGTYDASTTGLPDVTCGLGGASTGNAAGPISITAQNERQAMLVSDGLVPALRLDGCAYWNVSGLHLMSTDAEHDTTMGADGVNVMWIRSSDHNVLRRLLITNPNRYILTNLLRIESVTDSLLEESEFYFYNHNAVNITGSTNLTLRRSYANSRNYPDLPMCTTAPPDPTVPRCSSNPMAGGTGFAFNGNQLLGENLVSRNNATAGISLVGEDGRLLGSLSNQDGTGISATTWPRGFMENVVVTRSVTTGVYLNNAAGIPEAALRNITVVGSEATGIRNSSGAMPCVELPDGCRTFGTNLASIDNVGSGLLTTGPGPFTWTVRRSVIAGNTPDITPGEPVDDNQGVVRDSSTMAPGDVGPAADQCIVYIPDGSPLQGAGLGGGDIGANVVFRTVDGEETTTPLWDPQTSQFPCGATVEGVNDDPFESCIGINTWFNVGVGGCPLPTEGQCE